MKNINTCHKLGLTKVSINESLFCDIICRTLYWYKLVIIFTLRLTAQLQEMHFTVNLICNIVLMIPFHSSGRSRNFHKWGPTGCLTGGPLQLCFSDSLYNQPNFFLKRAPPLNLPLYRWNMWTIKTITMR